MQLCDSLRGRLSIGISIDNIMCHCGSAIGSIQAVLGMQTSHTATGSSHMEQCHSCELTVYVTHIYTADPRYWHMGNCPECDGVDVNCNELFHIRFYNGAGSLAATCCVICMSCDLPCRLRCVMRCNQSSLSR